MIEMKDIARAGVYVTNTYLDVNFFILPPNTIDRE